MRWAPHCQPLLSFIDVAETELTGFQSPGNERWIARG